MSRRALSCLIFLLSFIVAAPAAFSWGEPGLDLIDKYTKISGLPDAPVTSIYVTDEIVWVGTFGGGLAKFEVELEEWSVVTEKDGLLSDFVMDIELFKGELYVSTTKGLSILGEDGWREMKNHEQVQLLNGYLTVSGDTLWVAARNMRGGVISFDGEKWKNRSTMRKGVILNNVTCLAFEGKDAWIGTSSSGVYGQKGRKWQLFKADDGIGDNMINTLDTDEGKCYVGTARGFSVYDGEEWVFFDENSGLPDHNVTTILIEGGLIWIGTKGGLSVYDGEEFYTFKKSSGLMVDDNVTALFMKDRILWIGTGKGISRVEWYE